MTLCELCSANMHVLHCHQVLAHLLQVNSQHARAIYRMHMFARFLSINVFILELWL